MTTSHTLAQDNREDQFTSYFGMLIALGSWAMLFIALFASYGIIRVQAENWVSPASDPSSLLLAAINTGIILIEQSGPIIEVTVPFYQETCIRSRTGL